MRPLLRTDIQLSKNPSTARLSKDLVPYSRVGRSAKASTGTTVAIVLSHRGPRSWGGLPSILRSSYMCQGCSLLTARRRCPAREGDSLAARTCNAAAVAAGGPGRALPFRPFSVPVKRLQAVVRVRHVHSASRLTEAHHVAGGGIVNVVHFVASSHFLRGSFGPPHSRRKRAQRIESHRRRASASPRGGSGPS